jgi:hypothetical protein
VAKSAARAFAASTKKAATAATAPTFGNLHAMSMKKTDLEKHLAKKIAGESAGGRGGPGTAMNRREQALERKRQLLEKHRKSK